MIVSTLLNSAVALAWLTPAAMVGAAAALIALLARRCRSPW
jgi:hypothetical protein